MHTQKSYLLAICLFFFTCISFSQISTVTLSGSVKDNNDKIPLPFVHVVLKDAQDSSFITGTVTDDDGIFNLTEVASGNYLLEVSYTGYKTTLTTCFCRIAIRLSQYSGNRTGRDGHGARRISSDGKTG